MTAALGTYLGAGDRGETTAGPKLTSVPTLSSLGRPGSPSPELLTCEGTRIAEFCKWHFGAVTLPQKCQWHGPPSRKPPAAQQRPNQVRCIILRFHCLVLTRGIPQCSPPKCLLQKRNPSPTCSSCGW